MLKSRWARIVALTLLVLVLLVAAAPWFAGIGPVRRYVEGRIGTELGRPVEIEGLEAGWTDGVRLKSVRLPNVGDEFSGVPAVAVREIHVVDALTDLIFGDGPTAIVVEGLVVNVEEQSGGRTNLDDLLPRPAKPRPPPPPGVERKPPPPLRAISVTVRDATFTLRRLPPQPQPRPIDPFKEDPVILDADENATVAGVEGLTLDFASGADGLRVKFEGGLVVDDQRGSVKGDVRSDRDGTRGSVVAKGLDLAWINTFAGTDLAGRVDVSINGDTRGDVEATARIEGLRLPDIAEEWVDVKLKTQRDGDKIILENARITTASDTIRVQLAGDENGFAGEARLPLRHAFAPTGEVPGDGDAHLKVKGRAHDGRWDLAGRLDVKGFTFADRDDPPEDLSLDFDVTASTRDVAIRTCTLDALSSRLDVTGTTTLRAPIVCDLTSKEFELRLGRIYPLVKPFVGGEILAGNASGRAIVRRDAQGNVVVDANAEVRDFVAVGFLDEELRTDRSVLEIDAQISDGGNTIVARRLRLDDLQGHGTVHRRDGRMVDADGALKGTARLTPLVARVAGLERLAGTLTVDLTARTDDDGVRIAGRVTGENLRVNEYERDRVEATGSFVRKKRWAGELSVDAGADARVAGTVTETEDGWSGDLQPSLDLALLRRDDLAGRVGGRWSVRWANGRVVASGGLRATDLRVDTVRDRLLTCEFDVAQRDSDWRIIVRQGRLEENGIAFEIPKAFVDAAGSFDGKVQVTGPLEKLTALFDVDRGRGAADLTATVAFKDTLVFDGRLVVTNFALDKVASERAVLRAKGSRKGDTTVIESFAVDIDDASVSGSGSIGDLVRLKVKGRGNLARLAQHVPELSGDGPYDLEAEIAYPLRDGPALVDGTFRAQNMGAYGRKFTQPELTVRVEGRRAGDDWRGMSVALVLVAAGGSLADTTFTDVRGDLTGAGDLLADGSGRGISFRTQLTGAEVMIGRSPARDLRVQTAGTMKALKLPDLRAGTFSFTQFKTRDFDWRDGSGRFRLADRVLRLTDIDAKLNDGSVNGEATVWLDENTRWQTRFKAKKVRLNEQLGKPLSLMVPILRLKSGKAERKLTGLLDAEVTLGATGMDWHSVSATLDGDGNLDFSDVALKGSVILPLLSLRLDKILTGGMFKFRDLAVAFRVARGRVTTQPFRLTTEAFTLRCEGSAGLNGTLDFLMRPSLPPIPLKVTGSWDKPKVRPTARLPFR